MNAWKTIRVFISSTFRDMQAERDWLVRFVFPRLREDLAKFRIHFVDVDLRWGVTSDQNALGVCRKVIDECQPRFMCMLGGRYGWVPDGQDKSITADEIHYGVLGLEAEKRGHSFFYFRDKRATARMVEETPGDFCEQDGSDSAQKLAALKKAIVDAGLNPRIYGEDAQWDAAQKRLTGLEAFGNQVHTHLFESLKNDPELAERFRGSSAPLDEFAEEAEQMDAFIEERTERFVLGSRQSLLDDMLAFVTADGDPNIFVLTGDPGSGKSAFLAKFTREAPGRLSTLNSQLSTVLPHFIGASTGSTDLRRTLRRLCHELARAAGNTEPLPLDIKELITHFQKLLAEAADRRRVILVFDALNQFDTTDGAHWLNWLPRELPPGVRIVASVIAPADGQPEHQTLAILRTRPGTRMEKLEPLTEADTLAVIEGCLRRYAKRLSPEQLAALLAKPAGRLPLYVLTALEELRTLGTYEEITDSIRTLPGDARALFGWILTERLARDPGFRDREGRPCGAALVENFAACLGVSRHGLSPAELTALLDPGDPLGNVAALLRLLRPYLMRRGELLDFYHGQFREAAEAAWLKTDSERCASHQLLADYFVGCAQGTDPGKRWETLAMRGFAECVFHLVKAGQHDRAASLLSDFPFLLHKMRVGLLESVFGDYDLLRHEASAKLMKTVEIWSSFFREKANIFRRGNDEWPPHKILLQQAVEHADDSPVTSAAERWLAAGRCAWLRLQRVPRPEHLTPNPCRAVLEGHTCRVNGALSLPEGRILSWSGDKTLRVWDAAIGACRAVLDGHTDDVNGALSLPGGRILSWSCRDDKTLRVWDAAPGTCRAVLKGHTDCVKGALLLSDGRILSWSPEDETLRLWGAESESCPAVLEGHTSCVQGALLLPGGRILSWSLDKTLRVWDAATGACRTVMEGHTGFVNGALLLPDGRILSWSWEEKKLRVWDIATGACRAVLEGHTGEVNGSLSLPNGRILSWSNDHTLRVWDAVTGACCAVLKGHPSYVRGALLLSEGQILSWVAYDHTLRVWDAATGACRAVLEGHTEGVNGALVLPNGRILSWSDDHTLRVWDAASGTCRAVLKGHTDCVKGALLLPDGQILSWSYDKMLRVWDAATDACRGVLDGHTEHVTCALPLPDGRVLSWSRKDKTLRVWDTATGACHAVREGHTVDVHVLPDGGILSYSPEDEMLRVWDASTWACRAVLEGHTGSVNVALSLPDGRILSSMWQDKTLWVWDAATGACRVVLEGHTGSVMGALLLPDERILSWSSDETLRVWDAATGACRAVLIG